MGAGVLAAQRKPANVIRALIIGAVALAAIIFAIFVPPVAQSPSYHHFADTRSVLGIPNGWNVLSNIPFLIVGLWGLWFLRSRPEHSARLAHRIFFFGVALTCFGSAYYHWAPDNARLVWDRLPMTLGFMSLFAAIISERIDSRLGSGLLVPLLLIGAGSVAYWNWTERQGAGDLRPYLLVQFLPIVLIPLVIALYPARCTRTGYIFGVIGFYLLAKVFEMADVPIHQVVGVSGHTWKHLAAAFAVYWLLRMLQLREPVARTSAVGA